MADETRWVADRCPQCGGNLPTGTGVVRCPFCGSRLTRVGGSVRASAPAQAGRNLDTLCLKTWTYTDGQGIGGEAFRMLIPADWTVEGGITWPLNNPAMPGVVACKMRSPSGTEVFEALPNLAFFWTDNPMITMSAPMGSSYMGFEVRRPAGAVEVLGDVVLSRYRGHVSSLQVTQRQNVSVQPDFAPNPIFNPSPRPTLDGAKICFRYRQGEKEIEEQLYGVVEVTTISPGPFMPPNIFWQASYLLAFCAAADELAGWTGLYETMLRSFRFDPLWFARYAMLVQYLTQNPMQQVHSIGQIRQLVAQFGASPAMTEDVYQQQQGTRERLADAIAPESKNVARYRDPVQGSTVALPANYATAWANARGEVLLARDAAFDPNQGADVDWQEMALV